MCLKCIGKIRPTLLFSVWLKEEHPCCYPTNAFLFSKTARPACKFPLPSSRKVSTLKHFDAFLYWWHWEKSVVNQCLRVVKHSSPLSLSYNSRKKLTLPPTKYKCILVFSGQKWSSDCQAAVLLRSTAIWWTTALELERERERIVMKKVQMHCW